MRGSAIASIVAATVVFAITLTGCGGGGGSGDNAPAPAPPAGNVDSTPPTVLSATPGSNATGVSGNSTVVVNFSEAVNGPNTTSMRVSATGVTVPGTVTHSVNRLTATFTPSEPLACGAAHTLQLTSDITDLAGNRLAPTSWPFTVRQINAWSFVDGNAGTGINKTKADPAVTPQIISFNSKLYAIWSERAPGQVRVAVMQGTAAAPVWSFVDGNDAIFGINRTDGQDARTPVLAVHDGTLYAAWAEFNSGLPGVTAPGYQMRIAAYNSNDATPVWTLVDGGAANGLNRNPVRNASTPKLVAVASKLYAIWAENRLLVLGTPGDPLAVPPVPATPDIFVNQIRVARYDGNGTTSVWVFVDGNDALVGINPGGDGFNPHGVELNGKLYVTWDEAADVRIRVTDPGPPPRTFEEPIHQIRARVYNPAAGAPVWMPIEGTASIPNPIPGGLPTTVVPGLNKEPLAAAGEPSFAVLGSKLYLIWGELLTTTTPFVRQVRVRVYNGNDAAPSWTFVDGNAATGINHNTARTAGDPDPANTDSSQPPRLGVANGQLYATWAEANGPIGATSRAQIRAKVYNGNDAAAAWASVDGGGTNGLNRNLSAAGAAADQTASQPQLVVLGSKLYAAWSESNGTAARQIRVALAGCP